MESHIGPMGEETGKEGMHDQSVNLLISFPGSLVCSRGKKSMGGGNTKNKQGMTKGKKRGFKVYDGQRIPQGSVVVAQLKLGVLPGWNVRL